MDGDYFNDIAIARAVMSWAEAVELQLDRWESQVAQFVRTKFANDELPAPIIWQAQFERHFCLIASANLMKALGLMGNPIPVDAVIANEVRESRDLQEHWTENMPVFRRNPRVAQPKYPSGKSFAERNPLGSPYEWFVWGSGEGPRLTPHVTAGQMRSLARAASELIISQRPQMAECRFARAESPWAVNPEQNGWYPKP